MCLWKTSQSSNGGIPVNSVGGTRCQSVTGGTDKGSGFGDSGCNDPLDVTVTLLNYFKLHIYLIKEKKKLTEHFF